MHIILYNTLLKIVHNLVYYVTILFVTLYTLLKLNELQFVVHIARNCTKLLEIVHKIVLVPFADVLLTGMLCHG